MVKTKTEADTQALKQKKCFIIGPIGSEGSDTRRDADFLLEGIIREAMKSTDYELIRADRVSTVGSITTDVVNHILKSDLIIADLSEHNPNAFYELGIAHAAQKKVIHVCRKEFLIPFDNSHERTVLFDIRNWGSIEKARNQISEMVAHIEGPDFEVSNPVTVANTLQKLKAGDTKDQKIAELTAENETLQIQIDDTKRDNETLSKKLDAHITRNSEYKLINLYRREIDAKDSRGILSRPASMKDSRRFPNPNEPQN